MERQFNNIGDFKKFLLPEHETQPEEIPDVFLTRMARALDDDAFKKIDIERFLRGEREFRENSDPIEGEEGREQQVNAVREEYQKWRDFERWLLLSAATSDEEFKQRELEFAHLKKEIGMPKESITQLKVEDIERLDEIVNTYIRKNKDFNRPMNIVIFAHGSLRCHVHFGEEMEAKSGMLVAKTNSEKHYTKKVSVDNDSIIEMVYKITKRHKIGEANKVHLCLFYCHAHVRNTEKLFENLRVFTYRGDDPNWKGNKNPLSTLEYDRKTKELVASENVASIRYPKMRDEEARETQRNVNLNPVTVPEEKAAPTGTLVSQANSGDGVDEESVTTAVYTGTSSSDDDGERIPLVGDSVKSSTKGSDGNHKEDDTESERAATPGSVRDIGTVSCSTTKAGAAETIQRGNSKPEYVCYDAEIVSELIRENERGRDAPETLNTSLKEHAVVTGVDGKAAVEISSENPGGDSQQLQGIIPPNPVRPSWIYRAWQRVTNVLNNIDWYPHM